jgi:hypothetical protein
MAAIHREDIKEELDTVSSIIRNFDVTYNPKDPTYAREFKNGKAYVANKCITNSTPEELRELVVYEIAFYFKYKESK